MNPGPCVRKYLKRFIDRAHRHAVEELVCGKCFDPPRVDLRGKPKGSNRLPQECSFFPLRFRKGHLQVRANNGYGNSGEACS